MYKNYSNENIPELISSVINWAEKRNIFLHATTEAQMEKTFEEANELHNAIQANNPKEIIDGIGDILVTLIIQSELQGFALEDCLLYAYNEIKDRKGKIINGTFVKEELSNENS